MNTKLLLCLVLVLGGGFIPFCAQAYWISIPIDRTNISATAPFLRVVVLHYGLTNDSRVEFSVFVLAKDKRQEEMISGSLEVWDKQGKEAGEFISQTQVQARKPPDGFAPGIPSAVPKSWAGKFVVFRFSVAARFLSGSEFNVDETDDPKWGSGGVSYSLNLKEFAQENKP